MKRSDFLKRLIGVAGLGTFNLQAIIPKRKTYLQQFFVAGFRHYKGMELLGLMQTNDLLELRREPENEYDNCAVALYWQQEKIGYVPANLNELLSRLMDAGALPLLGMITHLNKEVKPWENVAVAIYFLQDDSAEIPPYASYLRKIQTPVYATAKETTRDDLYTEIFDRYNGIVDISTIEMPDIKKHIERYYNVKKYQVLYNNKTYVNIATDDIYTYMYHLSPIKPITTEDGKRYVLFEFIDQMDMV